MDGQQRRNPRGGKAFLASGTERSLGQNNVNANSRRRPISANECCERLKQKKKCRKSILILIEN